MHNTHFHTICNNNEFSSVINLESINKLITSVICIKQIDEKNSNNNKQDKKYIE